MVQGRFFDWFSVKFFAGSWKIFKPLKFQVQNQFLNGFWELPVKGLCTQPLPLGSSFWKQKRRLHYTWFKFTYFYWIGLCIYIYIYLSFPVLGWVIVLRWVQLFLSLLFLGTIVVSKNWWIFLNKSSQIYTNFLFPKNSKNSN
jgi:hypothetical protein